jgi:phage shock protein B
MTAVFIVAIVFSCIVLGIAIIAGTILMGMRMRQGGLSAKSRKDQAEEARLIQELYQGFLDMEKRVESLETILMDDHRKDRPS